MSQVCLSPSKRINTEHLTKAVTKPLEEKIKEVAKPIIKNSLKENLDPNNSIGRKFQFENKYETLVFDDQTLRFHTKHTFWENLSQALKNYSELKFCKIQNKSIDRSILETYFKAGIRVHPLSFLKFHELCINKRIDVQSEKLNELTRAAILNNENLLMLALNNHSIDQIDLTGRTALQWAAYLGHLDIINLLLQLGADPQLQTKEQSPPLYHAVIYGHVEAMKILLNTGRVNINHLNQLGETALSYATNFGNKNACDLLIKYKADVNLIGPNRKPPLIQAINKNKWDIFELLLDKGALIKDSETSFRPLYAAAEKGHLAMCKTLLERGANANELDDKYTWTPLKIAIQKGHKELVKFLINEGTSNLHQISKDDEQTAYLMTKIYQNSYFKDIRQELIKKDPVTKIYSDFFRSVKLIGHLFETKGLSTFNINGHSSQLDQEGLTNTYLGTRILKDLKTFTADFPKKFPGNRQLVLLDVAEFYFDERDLDICEDRLLKNKPTLIATGMKEHAVALLIWKNYALLCNRGYENRKPIEIFRYKNNTLTKGFIEEVQGLMHEDDNAYKKFFFKTFAANCIPNSPLEIRLENLLALPRQLVGNCELTTFQQALFALLSLEALNDNGSLKPNAPNNKIPRTIEKQKKIYENFNAHAKIVQLTKYIKFIQKYPQLADPKFNTLSISKDGLFAPMAKKVTALQRLQKTL